MSEHFTDNFEGRMERLVEHIQPTAYYMPSDVAELLAYTRQLEAKRTLDLRELFWWESDGPRAVYLDDVMGMIRAQLPDIEVLT